PQSSLAMEDTSQLTMCLFYFPEIGEAQLEIFSATPNGNGLSPILHAVPNFSSSQDETFSFATPSFAAASNLSALGSLISYFKFFPSLCVTERPICLPSSVPNVCSTAIRLERLVLLTVSIYSQMKAPIKAAISNQPYWATLFCLFVARVRWRSKNWR